MNKEARHVERAEGHRTGFTVGFGEMEREGRRVLRRLMDSHLFLAPEIGGQFALAGSRRAGRIMRVSSVVVSEFRARGWIGPRGTTPETFALTPAGKAWLAQSGAPLDPFAPSRPLLMQRRMMTPDGERIVTVNELESPLARLRMRGQITPAQFEAGERLRQDFTLGGLSPRLCADLTAPISNSVHGAKPVTMTETLIAARQRFRRAMAGVGPGLSDLLFDVCCHLKGLESVEASYSWPTRSAKVVLQIALDRLAAHYGIAVRTGRSRMRTWHADVSASA